MSISELEAHLGYWLRFVSNHVSHRFQQKVEAEGVTVSEWVILREVFGSGEISPSGLAERTGLTRGAVSKLTSRLLEKGLLARTVTSADRRNHVLQLTTRGRQLVPLLAQLADRNDAEFFGHLPPELRSLLQNALKSLVAHHRLKEVPTE